jgi:hypothetical protein
MTILWETYCWNVARTIILPKKIKTRFLAQRILESGRGTTRQAIELLNFGGMLYKPELAALCHGFRTIERYNYACFWTIEEEIRYFWALVHRKAFYPDVDKHLEDGDDLIDYIGRHGYCPPGYPGSPAHEKWVRDTGFQTYTDYIRSLVPEAKAQLAKYGLVDEETPVIPPTPIPAPTSVPQPTNPGQLSVVNGIIAGPNVHYRWVKRHDHFPRLTTEGIVLHGTGCLAGTSRIIVDGMKTPGICDGWDDPIGNSAHILNCRDGVIWQTVNLNLPAYHCYGWNTRTIGIENENMGPFEPWQEIFGWFIRFRGKPWEQRIRKSEMTFIGGKYLQPYTEAQLVNLRQEIAAIRAAWPTTQWIHRHSEMPGNAAWDPGPLFPSN